MRRLLAAIGPGILIAATGVGAGDLAVAGFTGSRLGTAVLWAVVVGAALKFTITEGLARWQLATGDTLLEGAIRRLGRPVAWVFAPYLIAWSFFVGSALMSACGVTAHGLIPIFDDPVDAKLVFGIAHSAIGLALVWIGGFAVFERVMGVCIAIMFAVVIATAALSWPGWDAVGRGLFAPEIPDAGGSGLGWTVALIGGVGGTLTLLCYGYWIREKGRVDLSSLRLCRVDLAVGYAMTGLFGIAMVIIGSGVTVEGSGAGLIVSLAAQLEQPLGGVGKWAFLVGAWGAVFSSLLGVWQAVPYLFADFLAAARGDAGPVDTRGAAYRGYLIGIAVVPALGLAFRFEHIQKYYAIVGAAFMPVLALVLLVLNGRAAWIGRDARTRLLGTAALCATIGFFAWVAVRDWS